MYFPCTLSFAKKLVSAVIVDQGCLKAAKFLPCNKTINGQGITQLYFKHLFPWFGIPKRIISD
jgi:hypothetical protein